ncbi:hypothetical protein ABE073_04950 [Lederbergia citrisecunda]|uniref:hypothetical protein n=1 Tax=Lederbergia citrisecunda TaxID=2833583 RepID=UPI003D27C1C9
MAKYRKKPVVVYVEPFALGMEDGFMDAMVPIGEGIRGVKVSQKPYVNTLEGQHPVEVGRHFIITDENGKRYPVEKEILEKEYELVDEEFEKMLQNIPQNSSIYGTERLEYLLKCIDYQNKSKLK